MLPFLKRTLLSFALLGLLTFVSTPASAQSLDQCSNVPSIAQGTKGFEECKEQCFAKRCGAAGLRCPTTANKRTFRRLCYGKCREMMRRQGDLRRLIRFCRGLRLERERAQRYRQQLILRHNMWMAKRRLVHRLKVQYENAKRRRQASAARAYYRRMQIAHTQQMQYMRQKLQMKARFYLARSNLRHRQRMELARQLGTLKKDIIKAKASGDAKRLGALRRVILAKKQKVYIAEKKEKKLKVDYHKTRVEESRHSIKQVKVKKQQLQEATVEAKKKKDQKRLEELAKRLGELAGKQAALTRKAQVEQQKLKKAKVAYAAISQRKL